MTATKAAAAAAAEWVHAPCSCSLSAVISHANDTGYQASYLVVNTVSITAALWSEPHVDRRIDVGQTPVTATTTTEIQGSVGQNPPGAWSFFTHQNGPFTVVGLYSDFAERTLHSVAVTFRGVYSFRPYYGGFRPGGVLHMLTDFGTNLVLDT